MDQMKYVHLERVIDHILEIDSPSKLANISTFMDDMRLSGAVPQDYYRGFMYALTQKIGYAPPALDISDLEQKPGHGIDELVERLATKGLPDDYQEGFIKGYKSRIDLGLAKKPTQPKPELPRVRRRKEPEYHTPSSFGDGCSSSSYRSSC